MKRICLLLLSFVFLFGLTQPVFAAEPKIVDDADILTESEETFLEAKAQSLVSEYGMDVVIVTIDTLHGRISSDYADDYFDYNGYGIGPDYSGVLLLLSMEEREWAISTCGDTIYALTDYGIQELFSSIAGYLSENRYYEAFDAYLGELPYYFEAYQSGKPIDGYLDPYDGPGSYEPAPGDGTVSYPEPEKDFGDYIKMFLMSLVIGAVAGGIVLLVLRGQMNTAVAQSGAQNYLTPGSFDLKRYQDIFLYSNVTRHEKPENDSSGGGGGSSVHTGSSGRSHGGGRGGF